MGPECHFQAIRALRGFKVLAHGGAVRQLFGQEALWLRLDHGEFHPEAYCRFADTVFHVFIRRIITTLWKDVEACARRDIDDHTVAGKAKRYRHFVARDGWIWRLYTVGV